MPPAAVRECECECECQVLYAINCTGVSLVVLVAGVVGVVGVVVVVGSRPANRFSHFCWCARACVRKRCVRERCKRAVSESGVREW
jgi:hypothetical protein